MDNMTYYLLQLGVMAAVTYLIRMLPMTLFTKKIENKYFRSFLRYIPYAVLGAMTFPAVIFCGGNIYAGIAGTVIALILAYLNCSLIVVALSACASVFIVNMILSVI